MPGSGRTANCAWRCPPWRAACPGGRLLSRGRRCPGGFAAAGGCAWRPGRVPLGDRIDPGDVLPAHRRCEATCDSRPERGLVTAGADPPSLLTEDCATSLRTWLRNAREQSADLRLAVPAMTPEGADGRELASLRPARDGLGVHAEHRGDLCRCQQGFSFGCACRHLYGLSSWTSTAILRCSSLLAPGGACVLAPGGACRGCPIWPTETILPSPAVTSRPPGAKILPEVSLLGR